MTETGTGEFDAGLLDLPRRLGRYLLCSEIAVGGMGAVYLARAEGAGGFDKLVAVKVIHSRYADDPTLVGMFFDEARIAARIAHPNVCQVFDFGEERGTHFLVMELLSGQPVSSIVRILVKKYARERPPWIFSLAARIIAEACEALHAAHTVRDDDGSLLNIIHRDVSPENILVTYDGAVRVMDFGIAKARGRLTHTVAGTFKGKLAYAAPEQIEGRFDHRIDIWSAGVVLWELLTGEPLFWRDSDSDTIRAVYFDPISPPASVRKDVPKELDAIVMRALSRDREARYATAREMAIDLNRFVAARGEHVGMAEVSEWMRDVFKRDHAKALDRIREARKVADADPIESGEVDTAAITPSQPPLDPEATRMLGAPETGSEPGSPRGTPPRPMLGKAARSKTPLPDDLFDVPTMIGARSGTPPATPMRTPHEQPAPPFVQATPAPSHGPGETPVGLPLPPPPEPAVKKRRAVAIAVRIGAAVLVFGIGIAAAALLAEREPSAARAPELPNAAATPIGPAVAAPPERRAVVEQLVPRPDRVREGSDDRAASPVQAPARDERASETSGARDERRRRAQHGRTRERQRESTPAADGPPGTVAVFTTGGWADIYEGDRKLGRSPARITLPAGRHTLRLVPFGTGEARRANVVVQAGQTARVTVDVGD